jgi:hypothetical protein
MVDTERQPLDTRFAEMLHILHAGGNYGYFWNRDPKTGHKVSEWWQVDKPTNPTNGVVDAYFGVHPTAEIPATNRRGDWVEPEHVRAQIPYIAAINALFGEYDAKDYGGKTETLHHIQQNVKPEPSIIIDSGGGYHAYWLLSETWQLRTADDRQKAVNIQAKWVVFVGSDLASKDLARVLRVPGTHNLKYDDKPLVDFVRYQPSVRYDLDYLVSLLPQDEAPQPHAAIAPRVDIADKRLAAYVERAYRDELSSVVLSKDGEKHPTLRNAAVKIGSILHYGISEDEAFTALHDAIAGKAKDIKRADDTIRDGLAFGKADPRDLSDNFATPQPDFDVNGMALCPTHHTPLVRTVKQDAWRCDDNFTCFYWKGEGYEPPNVVDGFEDSERIAEHTPIVFDEDSAPALPFDIDFNLGKGAGKWLDLYVDYASEVSPMTPRNFHETAALWLVSMAIARRVHVKMSFDNIYPNLFVLWVARSTIFSKTTAMNVAVRLAEKTFRHLLGPQDMTPEALYADMSGKEPPNFKEMNDELANLWYAERDYCAQRGFAWDEISGFLAKSQKEYNAGLIEAFLKFYDCADHKGTTKGGGRVWVKNTYVSLLGASTPIMMQQHFQNPQLASNGWWQRFIIVAPEMDKPEYSDDTDYIREPPHMQSWLHGIYTRLPQQKYPDTASPIELRLSDDVIDLWRQYNKAMRHTLQDDNFDDRFSSTYSRFPTTAIKVATILATMDWGESAEQPTIKMKHMVRAIEFCEHWRRCLHRVMGASVASVEKSLRDRIMRQVSKYDEQGGLKMADLNKLMKDVEYARLKLALNECVELGYIEETKIQGDGRGRPSIKYRLPRK